MSAPGSVSNSTQYKEVSNPIEGRHYYYKNKHGDYVLAKLIGHHFTGRLGHATKWKMEGLPDDDSVSFLYSAVAEPTKREHSDKGPSDSAVALAEPTKYKYTKVTKNVGKGETYYIREKKLDEPPVYTPYVLKDIEYHYSGQPKSFEMTGYKYNNGKVDTIFKREEDTSSVNKQEVGGQSDQKRSTKKSRKQKRRVKKSRRNRRC